MVVGDAMARPLAEALDHVPDALALVLVHHRQARPLRQAADLEDQHAVAIIVDDEHRVRRLAVVVVAQPFGEKLLVIEAQALLAAPGDQVQAVAQAAQHALYFTLASTGKGSS